MLLFAGHNQDELRRAVDFLLRSEIRVGREHALASSTNNAVQFVDFFLAATCDKISMTILD